LIVPSHRLAENLIIEWKADVIFTASSQDFAYIQGLFAWVEVLEFQSGHLYTESRKELARRRILIPADRPR